MIKVISFLFQYGIRVLAGIFAIALLFFGIYGILNLTMSHRDLLPIGEGAVFVLFLTNYAIRGTDHGEMVTWFLSFLFLAWPALLFFRG